MNKFRVHSFEKKNRKRSSQRDICKEKERLNKSEEGNEGRVRKYREKSDNLKENQEGRHSPNQKASLAIGEFPPLLLSGMGNAAVNIETILLLHIKSGL